jgi:hypothetical protein
MTILVNCPACRHVRQVPDHDVCLGVMCPYCHNAYMDAVDRPRGEFQGLRSSLSSSSYEVDVGQWFSYATAHWTSILGPAMGFLLIEGLVFFAICSLGIVYTLTFARTIPGPGGGTLAFLLSLAVMPLLEAGMIIVTLAQLKGERWTFGDFFRGFSSRWAWPLLGFTWMMAALTLVILTPVWVPVLVGAAFDVNQLEVIGGLAALIFVPLALYVGVRIGFFGPYLIIDRDFGPVEALQESWDLTTGHFWGLLGVTLLLVGFFHVAYAAGGIGVLFVLPLTALVRSAGYLLAGGTRPPMKQPEGR